MKNIIKRVIVGVLTGLILFSIKSCEVKAKTTNAIDIWHFGSNTSGVVSPNNSFWVRGNNSNTKQDLFDTIGFYSPNLDNYGSTGLYWSFGIGVTIQNIPKDDNNYSISGYFLSSDNNNLAVYVIGTDEKPTASNVNNIFIPSNVVSLCFSGRATSGSTSFTCSGLVNKTYYTIVVMNTNPIGLADGVAIADRFSYADLQDVEIMTQINDSIKEQTEVQKETNDFLKDTSSPDMGDYDFSSNNASNGVINNLITMPIRFVQSFLNGFNSSCRPFILGNLLGTDLTLPCINPGQYLGTIWNIIDVIVSGIFIFVFGKKLVKIFNDVTNLKENQIDEVFD